MMMLPECLKTGCSTPVTPSMQIDRCFWPNLHGKLAATFTGKSVFVSLREINEINGMNVMDEMNKESVYQIF